MLLMPQDLNQTIDIPFLQDAYQAVKRNYKNSGLTEGQLLVYDKSAEQLIYRLLQHILDNTYRSPELDWNELDHVDFRIVQEVARRLLLSVYDFNTTSDDEPIENQNERKALLIDIKHVLAKLPNAIITQLLRMHTEDLTFLRLASAILEAGVLQDQQLHILSPEEAQGGVFSGILTELIVDHLKSKLEKHGFELRRHDKEFLTIYLPLSSSEYSKEVSATRHSFTEIIKWPFDEEKDEGESDETTGLQVALEALKDVYMEQLPNPDDTKEPPN